MSQQFDRVRAFPPASKSYLGSFKGTSNKHFPCVNSAFCKECISVFSEAAFLHFLRVSCCNVSYAGGCFSYLSSGLRISVRFYIPKDNFSISHFMPPAVAKEGKGDFRGHPEPRQKTASSALLNRSLLRHQRMGKEGSGTPRVLAKDFVLCTPID